MSILLGKFPNKLPENFIKKTPLEFPKAWILKEKIEEFLKQNCQIPYGFLATITSEILFRRSSSNCFEHFSGNTCPKASCSLPKISFFFGKTVRSSFWNFERISSHRIFSRVSVAICSGSSWKHLRQFLWKFLR